MTRQAMNYLLGELERLGYLIRRDDPDDRRSKRVHLTERGGRWRGRSAGPSAGSRREWEQELGADRFARLRELLIDLNGTRTVRDLDASGGR